LAAGFDFSSYTSNPLSSIHTTLKRLVPEELETDARAEGQMYRWKTIKNSTDLALEEQQKAERVARIRARRNE
jgi:hypothetical protein